MPRIAQDPLERFWSKVDVRGPDECWPWMAGTTERGYGRFRTGGRDQPQVKAHRFAYECSVGPIPEGLVVMHSCDNPPCCNPRHLSPGTHLDNVRDMDAKGRRRAVKRDDLPQTKLTWEIIAEARRIGGPVTALAARLGVSKSTMSYALRGGRQRPSRRRPLDSVTLQQAA